MRRSSCFTQTFSVWFYSNFKLNFVKPTSFSFGYDYYAPAHFPVKSPNNFIAEVPSNPLLNLPFNNHMSDSLFNCNAKLFLSLRRKKKSQCSTLNVYHDFWGNNFHVLKCQMCCRHLPYWHFIVKYRSKLPTCTCICTDPYWPSCRPECKILHEGDYFQLLYKPLFSRTVIFAFLDFCGNSRVVNFAIFLMLSLL